MLWILCVLLIILWGWGFVTQIAGGMIHLLLLAAAAVGLMKILLAAGGASYKNRALFAHPE